jgi:hypothetical protein
VHAETSGHEQAKLPVDVGTQRSLGCGFAAGMVARHFARFLCRRIPARREAPSSRRLPLHAGFRFADCQPPQVVSSPAKRPASG